MVALRANFAGCGPSGTLLLATAAIAIVAHASSGFAMSGPPVLTGCVAEKTGLDCKGDLSKGLALGLPASGEGFTSFDVNIHDVTTDIAPEDRPGIAIGSQDFMLTIVSDTGGRRIVTVGAAPGISAEAAEVNIKHTGDIAADGFSGVGIYAYANPPPPLLADAKPPRELLGVTLLTAGDISVGPSGIGLYARAERGAVAVDTLSNITGAANSRGIFALANYTAFGAFETGDITVVSRGNITLSDTRGSETGPDRDVPEELAGLKGAIVAFNAGSGPVSVTSLGNISTEGSDQNGIAAYSGGLAFGFFTPIQIYSGKSITTTGARAHGILAASASAGVSVLADGRISTFGEIADGVHIASGNGAFVSSSADISANGVNADAIFVQSVFESEVRIAGGTLSGGAANGASIRFKGLGQKQLENHGAITGGQSGNAIVGMIEATEKIDNYGTISGDIDLAPPDAPADLDTALAIDRTEDEIRNRAGATLAGTLIRMGPNGRLINEGIINPGGAGHATTTYVAGYLDQKPGGVIAADLDARGETSDTVHVGAFMLDGNLREAPVGGVSASLSGKVLPHLISAPRLGQTLEFDLMYGDSEIEIKGLTVENTPLVAYKLLQPEPEFLGLEAVANATAPGVSSNTSALVQSLARLSDRDPGGSFEHAYLAFLNASDVAALEKVGQQFSSAAGSNALTAFLSGAAFANGLRSCPVADGPYGQQRETSCIWATPNAREFHQSNGEDRDGIDSTTTGLMGGLQAQGAENIWAGAGFSVEEQSASANHLSSFDTTWWQVGGVAKWASGPWKLSASIRAGQGDADISRTTGLGLTATATSSTDVTLVTSLARLSYSFGATGFYVTPMIDMGATWVRMGGFTEQGAGLLNLAVSSSDQWVFSASPAIEIGATLPADGGALRPFVKAGISFLSEDAFSVDARFASAPSTFAIASAYDDVFATLDAGLQLFSADGINLKLGYEGRFGANSRENGVDAKLSINY